MGLSHSPGIIPDGLVFYFDPINPRSYAGTGLTGYNLIDTTMVGSLNNGASYDLANKGSIYFDAVNDSISFSNSSDLTFTTITVCAWFKKNQGSGFKALIDKGRDNYGAWCLCIDETANRTTFKARIAGVNQKITATSNYNSNSWTYVCGVYDGSNLLIYQNGVLNNSSAYSGSIGNTSIAIRIGAANDGYSFDGLVASAAIYNRALSSTEILQNYNATKKRFSPEENIVLDGLILEFDAGNSSSYSGIGNTGYTVAGAGVTASLINGTSFSTLNGGSFVFDGSNDHIILNDFYLTQTNSSNEYTIMASGKLATINAGVRQLVSSDSGGYDWSFGAAGTGYFIFTGAGSTTASTQDLNWHIYAAQWSSAGSRLYLDNSLLINTTVAYDAGINQTFIGKNPTVGFGEYWNGNVGTVLIYNRILTTQELTQNYNALKGRYGLS